MFVSVLNTPLELLTIFTNGSILMFDWVADTPDMFKERQKLQTTCKGVTFRNVAANTKK